MDDGKMEIDLFGECLPRGVFADSELWGDIWRGWIVPVGGTTPDRRRWGGSSTDWNRHQGGGAGAFFPDSELWRIFGGGGSFRSGVQPPTGTDGEV